MPPAPDPAPRTRARSLLRGLRISTATALVTLLGLELAWRALSLGPPPLPVHEGRVLRDSPVERLPYMNRAGGLLTIHYRDSYAADLRSVDMHVNEFGYRGPALQRRKPRGTLRVACIGDSFTFGLGVGEQETWPYHLQQEIDERLPGRSIEVMNWGVIGYNSVDEHVLLEERVLAYSPDIVVQQFFINDSSPRGMEEEAPSQAPRERPFLALLDPNRQSWLRDLRSYSRVLDTMVDAVYRRVGLVEFATEDRGYSEGNPVFERTQDALERSMRTSHAAGARFLLAAYPHLVRKGGRFLTDRPYSLIQATCEERGIPWLDTGPAFEGVPADRLRVSPHDYHGNSRAHELYAGRVFERLLAEGWLEPRSRWTTER